MLPDVVIDSLSRTIQVFAESHVKPVVAGGLALSYWGNPRSTQDVDVAVSVRDPKPIRDALLSGGAKSRGPILDLGLFILHPFVIDAAEFFVTVELDVMVGNDDYYDMNRWADVQGTRPDVEALLPD